MPLPAERSSRRLCFPGAGGDGRGRLGPLSVPLEKLAGPGGGRPCRGLSVGDREPVGANKGGGGRAGPGPAPCGFRVGWRRRAQGPLSPGQTQARRVRAAGRAGLPRTPRGKSGGVIALLLLRDWNKTLAFDRKSGERSTGGGRERDGNRAVPPGLPCRHVSRLASFWGFFLLRSVRCNLCSPSSS